MQYTPPWPAPLTRRAGLVRRLWLGWRSWIHALFAGSYAMRLGEVRLPRLRLLIACDPALVQQAAQWPKHHLLDDLLGPLFGRSLFLANGREWDRHRARLAPALAHTALARALPVMEAAAATMVARLGQGGRVRIDRAMTAVAADVMMRTLISAPLAPVAAAAIDRAFARYQRLSHIATLLRLHHLPAPLLDRRRQAAVRAIHAHLVPAITARLAQAPPATPADMLDTLIATRDPATGAAMTLAELRDELTTLLLAGHETTAAALGWTLWLIANQPDLAPGLRAEAAHLPAHAPHPLLDAVLREALRLYPPVAFTVRTSPTTCQWRNKTLHPGDAVVIAPWLIHRHADHWRCPHAFDPDRTAAVPGAWLPFGLGPRRCPGQGFAMQEARVIVTALLARFEVAPAPGPLPEPVLRLTLRARRGIWLTLTPR